MMRIRPMIRHLASDPRHLTVINRHSSTTLLRAERRLIDQLLRLVGITMTNDVLIIVALNEEADELVKSNFYTLSGEEKLQNFRFQTFSFRDVAGVRRSGTLVCTGEVGQRARDAVTLFCSTTPTRLVINVGISGRIKDVFVGDVVVPTYVNAPSHRSAIEDDKAGGYHESPGGKPFDVSPRALALVKSKSFRAEVGLPTLFEFAEQQRVQLSSPERNAIEAWLQEKIVADHPAIVDGPFSAGQAVVKSNNYKSQVLGRTDRNIIALDMESAFIAAALANFERRPDFFSIRAISDPADPRKSDFDAIGNGLIRRWAMSNIRKTMRHLLEKTEIFQDVDGDLANSILNERQNDDYLSTYPGQRLLANSSLSNYDDRFANMRVAGLNDATFTSVLLQVNSMRKGGRILVQGRGGTGKSALLKKLQIELTKKGDVDTVFINVRKLMERRQFDLLPQLIDDKIINLNLVDTRPLYVFLDELYGDEDEPRVLSALSERLASRQPTTAVSFGQDHFEAISIKLDSDTSAHVYDRQYDLEIEAKAISMSNRAVALRVINGLAKTSHGAINSPPEVILEQLISMGFGYINHFIVSLYLDNFRKRAFVKLNSTQFVIRAMKNLFEELYAADGPFEDLCVEALRAHCRSLARIPVPPARSAWAERYLRHFMHFPRVVQTTLVANAVVYVLRMFDGYGEGVFDRVGIGREDFFGLVFDGDVNNAVKGLCADIRVEERVISSANKLVDSADKRGLSYALYLFGRVRSPGAIRIADTSMEKLATQIKLPSENSRTRSGLSSIDEKFWRLARRSWHISRSMRGDRLATDQYIDFVLTDPYEDELNRSFHLEYYGDYRKVGVTVELELQDTGGDWRRTRDVLARKLERMLASRRLEEYDRICMLTYFSLVRYRHELGTLVSDERSESLRLLESIEREGLSLRPQLAGFLSMMRNALEYERYNWIDAVVEVFKLKSAPRFGWKDRGMSPSACQIETIASHTFGAVILAEWLAVYVRPSIGPEDLYRLIRILLHHDLAEAYIGDFSPTDGITKRKEWPAVERMASLSTLKGLAQVRHIRSLFDDYERASDEIANLARDFDKLDAVIQGYIYAARFPSQDNRDEFFSYYLSQIEDDKLLQLAEEVVDRANRVSIDPRSEVARSVRP